MFSFCLDKILDFVKNNFIPTSKKNIGNLISSASLANPEKTLNCFVPYCIQSLSTYDEKKKSSNFLFSDLFIFFTWPHSRILILKEFVLKQATESEIEWFLNLLSCTVERTGAKLLKYLDQITQFLKDCFFSKTKPVATPAGKETSSKTEGFFFFFVIFLICQNSFHYTQTHKEKPDILSFTFPCQAKEVLKCVGKLMRNIIKTFSVLYILNKKSVADNEVKTGEEGNSLWKYWGKFYSEQDLMSNEETAQIWHIPTEKEIEAACVFYHTFSDMIVNDLHLIMKEMSAPNYRLFFLFSSKKMILK